MGNINSKNKIEQDEKKALLKEEYNERNKELQKKFKIKTDRLIKISKENSEIIEKIKDKDLIIILGNPGSGKSTLANYLVESDLQKEIKIGNFSEIIKVKENEKEFFKIKHKNSEIKKFFFFLKIKIFIY